MAGTSDYRWRTYHSSGPGRSRHRQAQAVSVATRKRKRPISLPRVSFLDDEKAEPEATKNDSWDGLRDG